MTFHFKARNGIWRLMQALRIQASEIVLVPAYNCGAELDAVLRRRHASISIASTGALGSISTICAKRSSRPLGA